MRRVHGEATEHVGANRLGRNRMRGRVHREGLDGTGDGNEAWRTGEQRKREGSGVPQNGGNGPPTVETGVLLIGRGVAYRKTDETDLLRSKRGSCSSGGVWRTAKRDSTGYCSSPPSTSSSLHGLPSTSSSLHGLLFIQPPPRATPPATVQPPLHGHPSTVYCSSSPPHHGVLFIQRQRHRSLFNHPPRNAHCSSQRQHQSASVSSSSEGIAPSGSVNSHRSIARVQ